MHHVKEEQEGNSIHAHDMANSTGIEGTVACDIAVLCLSNGLIEACA